jgi:hypothetical protein
MKIQPLKSVNGRSLILLNNVRPVVACYDSPKEYYDPCNGGTE